MKRRTFLILAAVVVSSLSIQAGSAPFRAKRGMVVSQSDIASTDRVPGDPRRRQRGGRRGGDGVRAGGHASDGGQHRRRRVPGLPLRRRAMRRPSTSARRRRPGRIPIMWLVDGKYDAQLHHNSHRAVGVPGTVAGFHLAWQTAGQQAVEGSRGAGGQARARRLRDQRRPRAIARADARQLQEIPRVAGAVLEERRALSSRRDSSSSRISRARSSGSPTQGPAGFYEGETAALLEKEMKANGGLITREDLKNYQAKQRAPIKGTYRGYEIIGMPPPSSGGIAVQMMLNILEAHDLKASGFGLGEEHPSDRRVDAARVRRSRAVSRRSRLREHDADRSAAVEAVRRASLRKTINPDEASKSSPTNFTWTHESEETTHFSIVDAQRNAVAVTYTLEAGYGSKIVAPGDRLPAQQRDGRLQRRSRPDQRAGPHRHRAEPRAPGQADAVEHVADDHRQGRQAVHGDRLARRPHHHQHRADDDPRRDRLRHERAGSRRRRPHPPPVAARSPQLRRDRLLARHASTKLKAMGHTVQQGGNQGVAQVIVYNQKDDMLEGGLDRRAADGGAAGK